MNFEEFNPKCKNCEHSSKIYCALNAEGDSIIPDEKKNLSLKKKSIIFSEGSHPQNLFAIVEGKVKISKFGEEGKEQIVRFAKKGDLIGYRSLLSDEAYRASATALSDVVVCKIPKNDFLDLLAKNQKLNADILKKLAKDLKQAENKILSISQKTVRERIAEALVILFHEFGENENHSIAVKLTRKEIGNIAGATIETTIRTLSDLKKEGLIKFDSKEIIIDDINKLINIANIPN